MKNKKLVLFLACIFLFGSNATAVFGLSPSSSNTYSSTSKLSNTLDPAIQEIKSINDMVESYDSEVAIEAEIKKSGEVLRAITVYSKDKRIYKDKDIKEAHIFLQSNNEKDETITNDYLYKEGKIYQFDGSNYNLLGNTKTYDFSNDTHYWNYLLPLYDNGDVFKKTLMEDNLVYSFHGKEDKLFESISKAFNLNMYGNIESPDLNVVYTFDDASKYPKSLVIEINSGDNITTEVKAFFTYINQVDKIEVPEGVNILE